MKSYPTWPMEETVRSEQDGASFAGGFFQGKLHGKPRGEHGASARHASDKREETKPRSEVAPQFSLAKIWADRYPDIFVDANYKRSRLETRVVMMIIALVVVAVIGMWFFWDGHYLPTGSDLIYNMGLTGGILLLVAFSYTLRKRLRIFKKSGPLIAWYYIHLVGGIVGPLLIIFHTTFALRAVNSTVALITMLTVVLSGVFGRYVYTRIGYHLHRRLLTMRETENRLADDLKHYQSVSTGGVERQLSALTEVILNTNIAFFYIPIQLLTLRACAAKCYVGSSKELAAMIARRAHAEGWDRATFAVELKREKDRLREHINALISIGQYHFYERLLVGWRIFHIPMLFILLVSGLVHVLAVHMY